MSQVALIACPDYRTEDVGRAVAQALAHLGGIERFVRPGQKVLLKVSLLMPAKPEEAVTTHPEIVRAVVREVQKAGGRPLIGDSCGSTYADMAEAYRQAGYARVAEETGAELVNFSRSGTKLFTGLANPHLPEVHLFKTAVEADAVIDLPKLKTHGLTLMTGAIKNLYGCVPGHYKARGHACAPRPADFAAFLVDIYGIIRPQLTIMDAVWGMEGAGPSGGKPRRIGLVLASPDAVAVDALGGWLIGYEPDEIETTRLAAERGLGESDPTKITYLGEDPAAWRIKDFKKTGTAGRLLQKLPGPILRLAKPLIERFKVRPRIMAKKCAKCLICVESCPVRAIRPPDDRHPVPEIDYQGCISCFCCQELCPNRAVEISKPWLLKILLG